MHNFRIVARPSNRNASNAPPRPLSRTGRDEHDNDHDHDQTSLLPQPEGDGEDGYSYGRGPPRATRGLRVERPVETVFDGDEELEHPQQSAADDTDPANTQLVPYAHRDIKPA